MDKAIAYAVSCIIFLAVAAFVLRLTWGALREKGSFNIKRLPMTVFYAAWGLSMVVFLICLVFEIPDLWQISGLAVLGLFVCSWFLPKPY